MEEINQLLLSNNLNDVILGVILGVEKDLIPWEEYGSANNYTLPRCNDAIPNLHGIVYKGITYVVTSHFLRKYLHGEKTTFEKIYDDGTMPDRENAEF